VTFQPGAEAPGRGALASAAFLNQGGDLLASEIEAIALHKKPGWQVFALGSGGKARYATGTSEEYADVSGYSAVSGLSRRFDFSRSRLHLGAFCEFGAGSYDADVPSGSVTSQGDLRYAGGGALARWEFDVSSPERQAYAPFSAASAPQDKAASVAWADPRRHVVYFEAAGRAGKLENSFSSGDLLDPLGRPASHDSTDALYYGAHAGLGYIHNPSPRNSIEFYAKYFWTRWAGHSATLDTGEELRFEPADSNRLRLGASYSHALDENLRPYAGLAWEGEFSLKPASAVRDSGTTYELRSSNLTGNTVQAQLGLRLTPSQRSPLSLDLGATGYAGERLGASGSLRARFEF
jgi:outer membrane autotransporter protein